MMAVRRFRRIALSAGQSWAVRGGKVSFNKKSFMLAVAVAAMVAVVFAVWRPWRDNGPGDGFVSGNGRIEATEVAVAAKQAGRIRQILVGEGEFVKAGQTVARMEIASLQAQRDEASARLQQARDAVAGAHAQVRLRESDLQSALALVTQRESELEAANSRLARSEQLTREGFFSAQTLDDDRARVRNQNATLSAAQAQVRSAQAAIAAARTQVNGAAANVRAAQATLERIDVDMADSDLKAPRDGRVQYLLAREGEVVGGGARVLNLLDLSDVYMTFFLPEAVSGRVALGSEVRIVLDAAPQYVIPASVSFVASSAQFTPKTVETASERQKLMFRVRAQIDRDLLKRHLTQVKTGLPGVAWLKIDANAVWPAHLAVTPGL